MPSTASSTLPLSERARRLKPSATLAVGARAKALRAEGKDVIGFGAGEPDFDTDEAIKQAAIGALEAGRTKYEPVPGPPEVREAIARKLRDENGIDCTAAHVVVTTGAKHALYLALQALVDPGRSVVVPTPAWVSYRPMVELCGAEMIEVPGAMDADFKVTPQQLEAALRSDTAAVMLNSPSNPCGTMYAPDELRALAEVVAAHDGVALITDEIYEKLVYGDVAHFSIGSMDAIADRVVTINGLSKSYAMTGWRLGYACATCDGVAPAIARLQGQMTSHPTSFCVAAVPEALTNHAETVESMREVFARRAALLHERLEATPGFVCPRPTGAFYAFPDVSACFGRTSPGGATIDSAVSFAEALLAEALVAVVPGDDFGGGGHRHIRLSFALSDEQIKEGTDRIRRWVESLN